MKLILSIFLSLLSLNLFAADGALGTASGTTTVGTIPAGNLPALGVAYPAALTNNSTVAWTNTDNITALTFSGAGSGQGILQLSNAAATGLTVILGPSNVFANNAYFTNPINLETAAELKATNNAGTTGQLLTSAGSGKAPYWAPPPSSLPAQPVISANSGAQYQVLQATNATQAWVPVPAIASRRVEYMFCASANTSISGFGLPSGSTANTANGTISPGAGPSGLQLATTTSALSSNTVFSAPNANNIPYGLSGQYTWIVALTNTSNVRSWIGVSGSYPNTLITDGEALSSRNFAGFRYSTNNANWQFVTDGGSGAGTTTTTSVQPTTSIVRLDVVLNATSGSLSSAVGFINGVAVATNVLTLPAAAMVPAASVQTLDTTAKALNFYLYYGEYNFQ